VSDKEHTRIRLELPARLIMLRPLNSFLTELIGHVRPDLDEKSLQRIALVLHEAFTNVCLHAYKGKEDGEVVVEIVMRPHELKLSLEDEGAPFDEQRWKEPDLDQLQESGKGVWLMKQFVNEFIYESRPDGKNALKLIMKLPDRSLARQNRGIPDT
jgi:serine/threonine-protein kinase RsbW